MQNIKKAFSLIEIIISIRVITIISVVAYSGYSSFINKSNNSKIEADLNTLNNALISYIEDSKVLPEPSGNMQFYGEDGSYRHDFDTAFGVSSFITQDTLPNKYIDFLPLDPKTNQYYAYGKTKDFNKFELAGVIYDNITPLTKLIGNWNGEIGVSNLIKEFAGPNFVYNKSKEYFPYNPLENMLIAKINSFSGELKINNKTYSQNEILNYTLGEGDKITVGTGGYADIYYSDGSNSILGDTTSQTEIVLANMKYKEDNNLFTSIKIVLNIGNIWTKAAKLGDKSEFEIYTIDTVAAVRGTIFGVNYNPGNGSNIVVLEGKVEVKKINSPGNLLELSSKIQKNTIEIKDDEITIPGIIENNIIEVFADSDIKGVLINNNSSIINSNTGSLNTIPDTIKNKAIGDLGDINNSIQLELINYYKTGNNINIEILLNNTLKNGEYLKLNSFIIERNNWSLSGSNNEILILTGSHFDSKIPESIYIAICGNNSCTKKLEISTKDDLVYDETYLKNPVSTDVIDIIDENTSRSGNNSTDVIDENTSRSGNNSTDVIYENGFKYASSKYQNCDENDIVIPNGQIWAACNLGTNKAGFSRESYGSYFNVVDDVVNTACGTGYKVPTKEDWLNLREYFKNTNGTYDYNKMIEIMLLPKAGVIINNYLKNDGEFGGYLTSSKKSGKNGLSKKINGQNGFYRVSITGISILGKQNDFINFYNGNYKYSIRCIKR